MKARGVLGVAEFESIIEIGPALFSEDLGCDFDQKLSSPMAPSITSSNFTHEFAIFGEILSTSNAWISSCFSLDKRFQIFDLAEIAAIRFRGR